MDVTDRAARDTTNAHLVQNAARQALQQEEHRFDDSPQQRIERAVKEEKGYVAPRIETLRYLQQNPFDVMVEIDLDGDPGPAPNLFYANESSLTNERLGVDGTQVWVVPWTHPYVVLAMSTTLEQKAKFESGRGTKHLRPLARARFRRVLPTVSGLYEPGGKVDEPDVIAAPVRAGFKAIKYDMTPEQVEAFLAKMDGYLLISGAPGTGKTTIAFQRIRFLIDQREFRAENSEVEYTNDSTCVFLASDKLVDASKELLTSALDVPASVVRRITPFIETYIDDKWLHPQNARLLVRTITPLEQSAREAMFNLCVAQDLRRLWSTFEQQIQLRLLSARESDWYHLCEEMIERKQSDLSPPPDATPEQTQRLGEYFDDFRNKTTEVFEGFLGTLTADLVIQDADVQTDPTRSKLRIDSIYAKSRRSYEALRSYISENDDIKWFDTAFARWLFWVYDPLDAIARYFKDHRGDALARIKRATGDLIEPTSVVDQVFKDWNVDAPPGEDGRPAVRQFGRWERSWIAWLLRFALPESADGFREIRVAFPGAGEEAARWSHVVIDEAQDLAVQEASFLASMVHPKGALTVSADFRQVVSPVRGMEDAQALRIGSPMGPGIEFTPYPFKENLRQSREIGLFLRDFYRVTFGELAPFEASTRNTNVKPQLYVTPRQHFPLLVTQVMNVLSKSTTIRSVAVLQMDSNPEDLDLLRQELKDANLPLAPPGELFSVGNDSVQLFLTSAEDAKGLEFDACIVLGLDDVERYTLTHSKNRAYVSLSRPTNRLFMICEQFPALLKGIDGQLYDQR